MRTQQRAFSGTSTDSFALAVKRNAHPLNTPKDLDPLMDRIGDARIVMLGEASHGTHEYYTWRSYITKRLITEKGFRFIAVEGDWPDCYKLNRYIKDYTSKNSAADVLQTFDRWPAWMWANWETAALAEWLKRHNSTELHDRKAGFYGLDMYSLWESMESILQYLEKTDPQALKLAQDAYRCFEPYREGEGRDYASAVRFVPILCENEVANLLAEIRRKMPNYDHDYEAAFSAEQNALIAVNAEGYYRSMLQGGAASWNARDRHMQETLERLLRFHGSKSKVIVWAHNTHIGDSRFTDMAIEGMQSIGELSRKAFRPDEVVLVGFGSYEGSVVAGNSWGDDMRIKDVPKGIHNSWEWCMHLAGPENKLLLMNDFADTPLAEEPVGHRAIGVVYNPQYEHYSNYVPSVIAKRYDAFLYLDQTQALHPMRNFPDSHQMPHTFPFGI